MQLEYFERCIQQALLLTHVILDDKMLLYNVRFYHEFSLDV